MIQARYEGNNNYNPSAWTSAASIDVNKGTQSFSWPDNPYGSNPTLKVGMTLALMTAPDAGKGATRYQVSSTSSPSDACSVAANGTITAQKAGTCVVEGQYAGDADYNAATWVALAGITVAKGDQSFSWPASAYGGLVPTMTFGGSNLALANTPSAGEGATRYRISSASSPSDACSVDNSGTLTPQKAGSLCG